MVQHGLQTKKKNDLLLIFAENTATFIYEFDANLDGVYDSSDEKETSIVNYSLNNNEITIIEGNSTAHGVITGNQLILSSDGDSITYYKNKYLKRLPQIYTENRTASCEQQSYYLKNRLKPIS